jgi:hypothetical protein
MRYDIEFIRRHQGVVGWSPKNVRLLDMLQGEGTNKDEIYFNAPCSICADDDYIYVADSGNGCIKKYSADFNYITTIRSGSYVDHDIQTISINPYSFKMEDGTILNPNTLWVFSTVGTSLWIHVIDGKRVVFSHRVDKL